mmetsp:Transcript_15796/g.49007  ORF Transcript_15796/g.49007 Transcript_15796/m.49007 type:complete len:231 (-) Transcript_15796:2777-3469(-)
MNSPLAFLDVMYDVQPASASHAALLVPWAPPHLRLQLPALVQRQSSATTGAMQAFSAVRREHVWTHCWPMVNRQLSLAEHAASEFMPGSSEQRSVQVPSKVHMQDGSPPHSLWRPSMWHALVHVLVSRLKTQRPWLSHLDSGVFGGHISLMHASDSECHSQPECALHVMASEYWHGPLPHLFVVVFHSQRRLASQLAGAVSVHGFGPHRLSCAFHSQLLSPSHAASVSYW